MGEAADWTFRVVRVEVADWADVGPLYEGRLNEDGERPIRRPNHEAVVIVEDARGELFTYTGAGEFPNTFSFGTDFDKAQAFAARVAARGTVRGEFWTHWRTA